MCRSWGLPSLKLYWRLFYSLGRITIIPVNTIICLQYNIWYGWRNKTFHSFYILNLKVKNGIMPNLTSEKSSPLLELWSMKSLMSRMWLPRHYFRFRFNHPPVHLQSPGVFYVLNKSELILPPIFFYNSHTQLHSAQLMRKATITLKTA